jgi:NhaA family Na+:H+ antiporter
MTGLLIGKPAGILISTFILTKLKVADLPEGSNWLHILGVGLLAGIGFTMSIFISILSFSDPLLVSEAKLSVLISSCVAGATGYLLLSAAGNTKDLGARSEKHGVS